MLETDEQISDPIVRRNETRRISRSQNLRDALVNYYDSRCQVCGDDAPFRIPTEIPSRFYVEVHHVEVLAEPYALKQAGLLVGLRVSGLCNLTVLCPHHHAVLHHHWPAYEFDREKLLWRHNLLQPTLAASPLKQAFGTPSSPSVFDLSRASGGAVCCVGAFVRLGADAASLTLLKPEACPDLWSVAQVAVVPDALAGKNGCLPLIAAFLRVH